jgi:hypothetical protein
MTAAIAFLLFALIGAGCIAVFAALGSHVDELLAEPDTDPIEDAHEEMNRPW